MTTKRLTLLALIAVVLLAGVTRSVSVSRQEQSSGRDAERRGTIAWHVKQAKMKGKNKATLLPIEENPAVVADLADALSQYTAVVVRPVSRKSYVADGSSLVTWNNFKVVELLSRPTGAACAACLAGTIPPDDLLPLQTDEILVPTPGGNVVVDGVKVVSKDKHLGEHFADSRTYLLFISLDAARGVGRLNLGPYGVFALDPAGQAESVVPHDHPIKRDLERLGGSLDLLKGHLRKGR